MYKIPILLALLLPLGLFAQSANTVSAPASSFIQPPTPDSTLTTVPPELKADESGFLSYIDFSGSSDSSGNIFTLGFSVGYQFNRRISVDAHVPFYFESASTTTTTSTGATQSTTSSDHGLGDPSFALLLRFPNRVLDYKTRLTTWVPVAEMSSGFTTGSVLVDWTSHLSRPIGRWLPFGQVDIANTVPDSSLFLLPYTAQGFNARFEGGMAVGLTKIFSAGASGYYVLPSGQQHLYSREFHGSGTTAGVMSPAMAAQGNQGQQGQQGQGGGSRNGFMTQHLTEGSDLTRDHGFSTWLTANLPHFVDLQIGFTRSYGYDLNTVSFGIGFDPVQALRRRGE